MNWIKVYNNQKIKDTMRKLNKFKTGNIITRDQQVDLLYSW